MTTNPNSKAYVAALSFPCECVSGIISSLITYNIVPPANASANGNINDEIEKLISSLGKKQ